MMDDLEIYLLCIDCLKATSNQSNRTYPKPKLKFQELAVAIPNRLSEAHPELIIIKLLI